MSTSSRHELLRRREELTRHVARLTFDLGGLVHEMASAGDYRTDLLDRRSAELRVADAELSEIRRLVDAGEAGETGRCRRCDAVHGSAAVYCWRCGDAIAYAVAPEAAP